MSIYDFNTDNFNQNFTPPTKRNTFVFAWGKVLLSGIQWLHDLFFTDYVTGNTDVKVSNYSAAITYSITDLVYYATNGFIYECILSSTGNAPTNVTYFQLKSFAVEDRIRYVDKSVYECILANATGVSPINTLYWIKIQDEFIGLLERTKTNSQILLFEYLLNKWFDTSYNYPSVNDIFITNLPSDGTSFVYGVDESESSAVAISDTQQSEFIGSSFVLGAFNFTINIPLAVYDALSPLETTGTTTNKDNIVRQFADNYVCAGLHYSITPY